MRWQKRRLRAANMVLLGAVSNFLEIPAELLTDTIGICLYEAENRRPT